MKFSLTEWPDIGFNFLIGSDGRVYVGRGWKEVGQFSLFYNEKSLVVAFIGNYYNVKPPRASLQAAKHLIECAVATVSKMHFLPKRLQHILHFLKVLFLKD